jgi:hypothetical protein
MLNPDRMVIDYETTRQIKCDIAHYNVVLKTIKEERARSALCHLITELEDRVRQRRNRRAIFDASLASFR